MKNKPNKKIELVEFYQAGGNRWWQDGDETAEAYPLSEDFQFLIVGKINEIIERLNERQGQ